LALNWPKDNVGCPLFFADGLPPLEVLRKAKHVGKEVFESKFFSATESYYVLYEHPALKDHDKVFLVERQELLPFLQAKIKPERGEGLDITVTSHDLNNFLICNHDGDLFFLVVEGTENSIR